MRYITFLLFLSLSSPFLAQFSYSADDYFNATNPSAFAEKKIYTSNTVNYSRMATVSNLHNFFSLKQQIGSFSFGLNNELYESSSQKSIGTSLSTSYSWKMTRKLLLNSGLSLGMYRDNLTIGDCATPPVDYNTYWNPAIYSLNIGMSLVSKKWSIGLAGLNLNRPIRTMYAFTNKSPIYISANASYRFQLDSANHFSLTPSLFYQLDVNDSFHQRFLSLKFDAYQHSIGVLSQLSQNFGLFYEYKFKNKLSLGAAMNSSYSALSSNIFNQSYLSYMFRVSYSIPSKFVYKFTGTPSF